MLDFPEKPVLQFNPAHDSKGRFAPKPGGLADLARYITDPGARFVDMVQIDPEHTNEEFAKKELRSYVDAIPRHLLAESSIRKLEVFDDLEDCNRAIAKLYPYENTDYAVGVYDRGTHKALVTLWISDDMGYSGRNFYHEFAHSLENRVLSSAWSRAAGEWRDTLDEGFAEAFAGYMVAKRGKITEELNWYREYRPITTEVFQEWGL